MKVVIDTNVIAYYLLGTEPFAEECRDFWIRADKVVAPAVWQSEIVNVLWMAVRKRVIGPAEGADKLRLAGSLQIESVATRRLWHGALLRSINSAVSAYDTLFIELAVRRKIPLAAFDAQLLRVFPEIAKRPFEL